MATLMKNASSIFLAWVFMIFAVPAISLSYDINEKLSVDGMLTGIYQIGDFDDKGVDDADRGAVVFDLGGNFHPTGNDEFQVTMSYAAGNGLNSIIPFSLVTFCALDCAVTAAILPHSRRAGRRHAVIAHRSLAACARRSARVSSMPDLITRLQMSA